MELKSFLLVRANLFLENHELCKPVIKKVLIHYDLISARYWSTTISKKNLLLRFFTSIVVDIPLNCFVQ